MNREPDEPDTKDVDPRTEEDIAREAAVVAPIPRRPTDADWPEESADSLDEKDVYGDPDSVKDESPLESLGEAVSEPLRKAAGAK